MLNQMPIEEIQQHGMSRVAEAVQRMREGKVQCDAGYDGNYGAVRLFDQRENASSNVLVSR